MANKRIYEIAKQFNLSSNALVKILRELGYAPKSHMSVATDEMTGSLKVKMNAEKAAIERSLREKKEREKKAPPKKFSDRPKRQGDRPRQQGDKTAHTKPKPQQSQPKAPPQKPKPKPAQSGATPAREAKAPPIKAGQVRRPPGQSSPTSQKPTHDRPVRSQSAGDGQRPAGGQQARPGGGGPARPGGPPKSGGADSGGAKKRKRDKRKKKDRHKVDQKAVAKSFKATIASMETGKKSKKYKRRQDDEEGIGIAEEIVVEINEFMTVAELAGNMGIKPTEIIQTLFQMGSMASINHRLDMDTIEMLSIEFGFKTKEKEEIGSEAREEESAENLKPRAPVVTVMGHVDHGKTSLLDFIRHTNVVAGEAGAITQHIGAYEVVSDSGRIVFIDTPGHEAFTAMRARGAQITDIVILVVAADDGVMPQTVEAIDHARAAGVPIIVAINKIDKAGSSPDVIKQGLSKHNLMPEEWGGKTIMCEVSAKMGTGIDHLLEMVHLQAEILDLKADPTIRGQGIVVEAKLEKGRGPVSTIIIQTGQMKVGDPIVAGTFYGHIRSLLSDREEGVKVIGPATPARITGLNGVPQAGDSILVVKDDQEARDISQKRMQLKREQEIRSATTHTTLENLFDQIKEGQIKELRLVIKADVDGSAEVLSETLSKIATNEVKTTIIRKGVGAVSESDVLLAAASNAIIIGFNVSPDGRAREAAAREKVSIKQYSIIYEVESDIRKALEGMLSPEISEELTAVIEVRQVFKVPKIGAIAGSFVQEGNVNRNNVAHLVRDGVVVHKGPISSLKRFKDDVKEVAQGYECGIGLENFNDVKVGDSIEIYKIIETAKKLDLKENS